MIKIVLFKIIRYAKHIYLPEPQTHKRAITAVKAEEAGRILKKRILAFVFMIVLYEEIRRATASKLRKELL